MNSSAFFFTILKIDQSSYIRREIFICQLSLIFKSDDTVDVDVCDEILSQAIDGFRDRFEIHVRVTGCTCTLLHFHPPSPDSNSLFDIATSVFAIK